MLVETEEHLNQAVNPESCRQMGKDCRDCISSTAAITALLCPSMDAVAAQQTFFLLYRHEGCGGMARAFVREYLGSCDFAVEPEYIERKPVKSAPAYYQIAACA